MSFHKYQGTGNDFIIIDDRESVWEKYLDPKTINTLCHRRFGIGADGLMLLMPHPEYDFYMKYYNADGNESSMCGNGGRCLVEFAHQLGVIEDTATFLAIDGDHEAFRAESHVRLRMSTPKGMVHRSETSDWIDTGSPHLVEWANDTIEDLDVVGLGEALRYNHEFAPGGTNVNFAFETSPGVLSVRTYERGVEDETLSCGTGVTACAYTYMARRESIDGTVSIQTPGGNLEVQIRDLGKPTEEVWLSGAATFVFSGEIFVPE